jgi:ABC-type phosphate/phosphonate transport system substrate-binding protein
MRMRVRIMPVLVVGLGMTGCQQQQSFSTSIWNPLGLEVPFTLVKKPVRIGVVAQKKGLLSPENWLPVRPAPPYAGLREALAGHLGCGVQIEEFAPFQIAAHLQSGRLQYALVSESDHAAMLDELKAQEVLPDTPTPSDAAPAEPPEGPAWTVIATGEVLVRRGLIVASAKSEIQSISQIAGKRFAFGPKGDAVLDAGAMRALEAGGVGKEAIAKELLPIIPNLDFLQYHISSSEAAKEVVYGIGTPAGVIEESEYEAYPATGGRLLPLRFAKDNFRILGRTEPVRSETSMAGPFLASRDADPQVTEKVAQFLASAAATHQRAMHAVGLARFEVKGGSMDAGAPVATTRGSE